MSGHDKPEPATDVPLHEQYLLAELIRWHMDHVADPELHSYTRKFREAVMEEWSITDAERERRHLRSLRGSPGAGPFRS